MIFYFLTICLLFDITKAMIAPRGLQASIFSDQSCRQILYPPGNPEINPETGDYFSIKMKDMCFDKHNNECSCPPHGSMNQIDQWNIECILATDFCSGFNRCVDIAQCYNLGTEIHYNNTRIVLQYGFPNKI